MDLLNPFFTKGLTARISKSKKCIKATVVSCDITGGITLGTKLTMPIFNLYLPHNLQSRVLVF